MPSVHKIDILDLAAFPPQWLPVTLDQLRSFCAVIQHGSVRDAAKALGREHASVEKQMRNLALERFWHSVQEPLYLRPQKDGRPVRGVKLVPTASGERVHALARQILLAVQQAAKDLDSQRGRIVVGTTTFLLPMVLKVLPLWQKHLGDVGIHSRIEFVNLHSHEIHNAVESRAVDFGAGPFELLRPFL